MTLMTRSRPLSSLLTSGSRAALLASAANLALFFGASSLDIPLVVSGPGGTPMTLTALSVISVSVIGTIGAALALLVVNALARRPRRTFSIIALAALLLSLIPVLTSGLPPATVAALVTMHIVAASVITTLLSRVAQTTR